MVSKLKEKPFEVYPIETWSVSNYGTILYVNPPQTPVFEDIVSLDVEDDEQDNFVGIGIYDGQACYYWSDWKLVKELTIPPFIAHNGISDVRKLQKWGFLIDDSWLYWDTQLTAHFIDSSRKKYGLKTLVKQDLGIEYPSYEDIVGKRTKKQVKPRITLDKQPLELVSEYNAMDCYSTYKLYEYQKTKLIKTLQDGETSYLDTKYIEQIEKPARIVFRSMEDKGIRIDLDYLKSLKQTLESQLEAVKRPILNELGNINLDSPKQLLGALNAKGIRPILKGKPSTDKRALDSFRTNPTVRRLLQFSELQTLLSSFITPYLERKEEIVHPSYHQTGTRTGRPSCSNPNLLQIPKRTDNGKLVRRMFKARDGYIFGDCDFGQIEPRIMAHLSKDINLCSLFNRGIKFHRYTQEKMGFGGVIGEGPEYDRAKVLNLSVGYRATYRSVSQQLRCSYDTAQKEIDKWWSAFPDLHDWQQKLIYQAKKDGYCTTLYGRRIKIDDLNNPNEYRREGAERQLINNIVQGSAAEIMKLSMVEVYKAGIDILVQVYDELLFESLENNISSEIEIVIDKMKSTVKLDIPLEVSGGVGYTWESCK